MTTLYFIEHTSVFPILFNHFHPLNLFSCSLIVEHEVYVLFLGLDPACLSLPFCAALSGLSVFTGEGALANSDALIVLGNSAPN